MFKEQENRGDMYLYIYAVDISIYIYIHTRPPRKQDSYSVTEKDTLRCILARVTGKSGPNRSLDL